jgi:phage recombination protein Bet
VSEHDETGTALAVAQERRPMHTGEPAYKQFSSEMIALVGKAIMPDRFKAHELYFILELAATYGLDPFTKEIQAIRWTRNADSAVQAVVGRDGLLAIAQRHPDYLGFRCAAVYEKDDFAVLADPVEWKLPNGEPVYTKFRHSFQGFAKQGRGKLLGAFAEVYRQGKTPTDFMAYLEDYDKGSSSDKSPWLKLKDVMIEKVALVTALRLAFRVSGLYIREELSGVMLDPEGRKVEAPGEEPDYGEDAWTARRLEDLFDALGYLPAKRSLVLTGLDEEGRQELVAKLEREIIDAGGTPPVPPDPAELADVEAVAVAEEDVDADAATIDFPEPGDQARLVE